MAHDFLNKEIQVGDVVVYPVRKELHIGRVEKIHNKMITVYRIGMKSSTLYYPQNVLVVDDPRITAKILMM